MKGLLLAAVASLSLGVPDLLPPGERRVAHEIALDWPDDLAKVRFVVVSIGKSNRWREVPRRQPLEQPRFEWLRLYAVPAEAMDLPSDQASWMATGWPWTELPTSSIDSVADASPVHRVRADVLVEAVDTTTVRCRLLREVQFDRDGNEVLASGVLVPATAALLGIVLLFVFVRRRAQETA